MSKKSTRANPSLDFEVLHVGLVNAVICTRLPIEEATSILNREHPTGINSKWAFDGDEKNKTPCPDGQGKTHYRMLC